MDVDYRAPRSASFKSVALLIWRQGAEEEILDILSPGIKCLDMLPDVFSSFFSPF